MIWTTVEDKLPTPNIKVLACRIGKKTNTEPFFVVHKNRNVHPWEYLDGNTCYTRITHWMYIPELPKVKQNEN